MVVGILVFAPCATVCGGLWLINLQTRYIQRQTEHLLEPVQVREQKVMDALRVLDGMRAAPCSDADLAQLRQIVIGSTMILDIARRQGTESHCSALFGKQSYAMPALAHPGEVVSPEQTVWRNAELPTVSGLRFLLIAHRDFVLVASASPAGPPKPYQGLNLSRMFVNARTHQVQWLYGRHLDVPDSVVKDGNGVWHKGTFSAFACTTSGDICLSASTTFARLLQDNALWIFLMALTATVFGGSTGSLIALARRHRQTIPFRLRKALRANAITMHYQPIVDGASGAMIGAEALMRWPGADIEPDQFIPAAEQAGVIGEITRHSIRSVSRDLGDLLRRHATFRVTINITAEDLRDERLHRALEVHIEGSGIAPQQVALELTERLAACMEEAEVAIKRLRDRGYQFYIDDFGTGYSTLSYLSDLSVDAIKLDRSFTASVGTSSIRARLVRPILEMAREAGIPVIIEGVETEEVMQMFREHGALAMQGWYFGPAMAVEDLMVLVEELMVKAETAESD